MNFKVHNLSKNQNVIVSIPLKWNWSVSFESSVRYRSWSAALRHAVVDFDTDGRPIRSAFCRACKNPDASPNPRHHGIRRHRNSRFGFGRGRWKPHPSLLRFLGRSQYRERCVNKIRPIRHQWHKNRAISFPSRRFVSCIEELSAVQLSMHERCLLFLYLIPGLFYGFQEATFSS